MKIAITGHSAGIGQALGKVYSAQGHEIVGLSRRNGYNIRNIPKVADQIETCDMFINNAQVGFAQTELLFEIVQRWIGTKKHIIVISSIMTQYPVSVIPGIDMTAYYQQKVTLEQSVQQLRYQHLGIKFIIVRPGNISTSPDKTVPPAADVNNWATNLVNILNLAEQNNLVIPDISLGPQYQ
jgi:NADP-dependent 3-hydroxy acid dehydrogenase YdfG